MYTFFCKNYFQIFLALGCTTSAGRCIVTYMNATTINQITIPAGTYVIGDPCYSVPDARWLEWLEAADYMNVGRGVLHAELDGCTVVGVSTAYGDGVYHSNLGHELDVDAGLIGLVDVRIADPDRDPDLETITFADPIICKFDEDTGEIFLGHVVIPTAEDDEDEYEDEYF